MQDKLKKLDYENSLGMIARNASKLLEKAFDLELLRDYGMSGGQWRTIAALAYRDGLSQREVADLISLDSSTLVPIIDKLEQNGFVKRQPDPKDRRNKRIFLTEKSQSIIDSIVDAALNLRKAVYKDISARDMDIAKTVLRKVNENAESFISEKASLSKNASNK